MDLNPSSPLLARQQPYIYLVFLVALLIIGILLVIYIVYKSINKIHSSPQWLEIHRNLPTTKKNISNMSKFANLDSEETELLRQICIEFEVPNIEFLIRDDKAIDELFHKKYSNLCEKVNSEQIKLTLFSLRFKLEKARSSSLVITSTKSIVPGQEFIFTDLCGKLWTFTLVENSNQGLYLSIPQEFAESSMKPEEMSKQQLYFTSKSSLAYNMMARIIRFEQSKEGQPLMLVGHTNSLKAMQRRTSKRVLVNRQCVFSAVEVLQHEVSSSGKKTHPGQNTKSVYTPLEKRHEGVIQDISANGCRILCQLPIKKGQYIYSEFALDNTPLLKAIGLIVMTTQTDDKANYVLHIQFVEIEPATRNLINAFIYKYL